MLKFGSLSQESIYFSLLTTLVKNTQSDTDVEKTSENIISLLNSIDLSIVNEFFSFLIEIISKKECNEMVINAAIFYTNEIVRKLQSSFIFKTKMIQYFDNQSSFLSDELLFELEQDVAIILTTFACFSKNEQVAKRFLVEKLLKNIDNNIVKKVHQYVIFDISLLGIELSDIVQKNQSNEITQLKKPEIFEVVLECDSRTLTSPMQLKKLFNFFQDFDAKHAASFLTAIASKNCCFRDYFNRLEDTQCDRIVEVFRNSFQERHVDLSKIIPSLDQCLLLPTDLESCSLILKLIYGLTQKEIPSKFFFETWKNSLSQLYYLTLIAGNCIPYLDMRTGCKTTQFNDFQIQELSHMPNNCWICVDFVEALFKLSEKYKNEILTIFSNASELYSTLILITMSQFNNTKYGLFDQISVKFFYNVIKKPNISSIINLLWELNPNFSQILFQNYYIKYPNKRNLLTSLISPYLNDLFKSDFVVNLDFVIQLGFQASFQSLIEIDDFIKDLLERHPNAIVDILEYVKKIVLDSPHTIPILTSALNKMFEFLFNMFSTFSNDTKLLINTIYSICENSLTNIKKISFPLLSPTIKPPEITKSASEYFTKYLEDKLSIEKFLTIFHQNRVNFVKLYEAMLFYLLLEFKYLNQHNSQTVIKLGELVGHVVHENLLNEKQLKYTFEFFIKSFQSNSNNTLFSSKALEICYQKLSTHVNYANVLIRLPLFRNTKPKLYEKIKNLVDLSLPVQIVQISSLTLHPSLKRFERLNHPSPRICKLIQFVTLNPSVYQSNASLLEPHIDWISLQIVNTVQDHPKLLSEIIPNLDSRLIKSVVEASIFESIQLISNQKFMTFEGGFLRRRLSILGQIIGKLTLARNKFLPGRLLNIKHLLLHAFSQGKLIGVIPFVRYILCSATPLLFPPNPYISSILQVLASLSNIELLKVYIRNQISLIFSYFNVNMLQFNLISLVPDVKENNFDFIVKPYSINFSLSPIDIGRIIQFDEATISAYCSQFIVVPKIQTESQNAQLDILKNALTKAIYSFIKTDVYQNAKIGSTTAFELIIKDFSNSSNLKVVQEMGSLLAKQLASGLLMSSISQKLNRFLLTNISRSFTDDNTEWINKTIKQNINWIVQFLHEIISLKAHEIIQKNLEEYDVKKSNNGHNHLSSDQSIIAEQQGIYQELSAIPLSPTQFMTSEHSSEKFGQNPEFEKYVYDLSSYISNEIQQGNTQKDMSSINLLIQKCPEHGTTFDDFLIIMKIMMKYMNKVNNELNDKIYGELLKHILKSFHPSFYELAQTRIVEWLNNSVPSLKLLCNLIENSLLTTSQLDNFFFNSLNKNPFNYRLFGFALRFLYYTIFERKIIQPNELISTLTFVVYEPSTYFDIQSPQKSNTQSNYRELKQILEEMDTPLNILSPGSKIQTMSTFDPLEEINNSEKILKSIKEWALSIKTKNDADSVKLTNELIKNYGKDLFIILFFSEKLNIINQFFKYINLTEDLNSIWNEISSAIVYCIEGNALVINFDLSKYFKIMLSISNLALNHKELRLKYPDLLHKLRPLMMPSFAFSWIQLISERHLIYILLSNNDGWNAMKNLMLDYISSVIYIADSNFQTLFDFIYKSLLRFILVLMHDFPSFIDIVSPELVTFIPFNFTQLHNLLLSACPRSFKLPKPIDALKDLTKVENISEFSQIVQPLKQLADELQFSVTLSPTGFSGLASQLNKNSSNGAISAFIIFITNALLRHMTLEKILTAFQEKTYNSIHVYFIIKNLVEELNYDSLIILINVLVDQLRYPCLNTLFYYGTLLNLINDKTKEELNLDELILHIVLERAITPPPRPWGLSLLITKILTDKEINIYDKPFVKNDPKVKKFLEAASKAFGIE